MADKDLKLELRAIAEKLFDAERAMNRVPDISEDAIYEVRTIRHYIEDKADRIK